MDSARRTRSRPIAGLPVAGLRDGVAIAKRWLLELIGSAPLSAAASVPAARLAKEGPALCAAIVSALESDEGLQALATSPSAEAAGALAGAVDPVDVAAAVAALQAASWGAVRATLTEPSGDLVAAVSERLAEIAALVLAAALAKPATSDPDADYGVARADPEPRSVVEPEPEAEPRPEPEPDPQPLIPEPGGEEITVSKPSGEPWLATIAGSLARSSDSGRVAVLTVELDDIDRLVVSGSGKEVAAAIDAAERAMIAALAPADTLVRERVGRYWIVSPSADHDAARGLGSELAAAVSEAAGIGGTPLTASVGLAMQPDDGDDAETLARVADEGLYAARAAGIRIA